MKPVGDISKIIAYSKSGNSTEPNPKIKIFHWRGRLRHNNVIVIMTITEIFIQGKYL